MKWLNQGHEWDGCATNLIKDFIDRDSTFYVFGAGLIGRELKAVLEKAGCFAGFIDNDKSKQKSGADGVCVISLREYLNQRRKEIIIIAADVKNIPAIVNQLISVGLKEDMDFYEHTKFMRDIFPVFLLYVNDLLYIELAQICLTERCTLKCRKCAHACYAVDSKSQDMGIDMAKKSVDYFFYHIDIIKEFVLIGGEPFLYQKLDEIIEYIGKKYREKIITFSITTNGTIMPRRPTLELCRKYGVTIRISDYSKTIKKLEIKYEKLKEVLENNQIPYTLSDRDTLWMDYGFETVDRDNDGAELIKIFDSCQTPCREIRGNKYYYCVMARSVSDNLKLGLGKHDYLDLSKLKKEDRKILLEFQMGYSEKGYLDMCRHCNGADARNHPILPAEQIETNER